MSDLSLSPCGDNFKSENTISLHTVLEGLASIRQRNEELVEALDHSLERFERVMAFYQQDAYSA